MYLTLFKLEKCQTYLFCDIGIMSMIFTSKSAQLLITVPGTFEVEPVVPSDVLDVLAGEVDGGVGCGVGKIRKKFAQKDRLREIHAQRYGV